MALLREKMSDFVYILAAKLQGLLGAALPVAKSLATRQKTQPTTKFMMSTILNTERDLAIGALIATL